MASSSWSTMSRFTLCVAAVVCGSTAVAQQIQSVPIVAPAKPSGVFNAFPTQNPLGPTGVAFQSNYPYPGQCVADGQYGGSTTSLFPLLQPCPSPNPVDHVPAPGTPVSSFDWPSTRTAGTWADSGRLIPFKVLLPLLPSTVVAAPTLRTPKFVYPLLNPPDYTPDTATYPGADYYEIGVHEAWGFQALADVPLALPGANLNLFPNPKSLNAGYIVPDGMQWTGLICTPTAGCSCPPDASASFKAMYCTRADGKIPQGAPLLTPIWGVGQINNGGGPVTQAVRGLGLFTPPATGSAWSANDYVATWPSISIRANRGRPVVVKWVNEFPNNHVFCPHPEAADWPCAIDRTFMGVKTRVDPALETNGLVPADGVNPFGSPQQPDNSWVTHLHGGEIPPSTDGFAEKWFGNATTAAAYTNLFVSPPFENVSGIKLKRPMGNSDLYTYPMVQEEALIWFHDHTLGKTHHNVIAGPAGFFPIKEPSKHGGVGTGANVCPVDPNDPAGARFPSCTIEFTWLDPVTEPRNVLNQPLYDLFLAVQDRSFNDDGTINFSNTLGQTLPAGKGIVNPIGWSSVTPGVNPQVHPTWVPEYFGDHALINGVLWPQLGTAAGWYRIRFADGSDSRCYTIGFQVPIPGTVPTPAAGTKPINNLPFWVIANDQGYLQRPVLAPGNAFTMCPGERYEILVNFGALPAGNVGVAYMTNSAAAPFPAGLTPFANASPYAEMNTLMMFNVKSPRNPNAALISAPAPVTSCAAGAIANWDPSWDQAAIATAISNGAACMPANPALVPALNGNNFKDLRLVANGSPVRQMYLNERVDGVTLAPMGMQLNGVPFEYKVTETPQKYTKEIWQFINLTVDAHPIHPHLVSHQVVSRQAMNVGMYKSFLCGSSTCQPGPAPGGEMQVVPDVKPALSGTAVLVTAASIEGGRKDVVQAPPGMVTTIIADWSPRWNDGVAPQWTTAAANAPGSGACGLVSPDVPDVWKKGCTAPYVYESATSGPYVWHCHINSHEDSEMMRTSLVVPPRP